MSIEASAPTRGLQQYREEIEAVCRENGVRLDLVLALLELEERHQNLHSWGAKPRLRREIGELLDEPLRTLSDT